MRLKTFVFVFLIFIISVGVCSEMALQDVFNKLLMNTTDPNEARKKKKKDGKYVVPLLFGALMIKSIIFPLAFKVMAVMSSIAVLLSTMSLIISSIVGYLKLAFKPAASTVKIIQKHPHWAKDDENATKNIYNVESVDYEPNQLPFEHYYYNRF